MPDKLPRGYRFGPFDVDRISGDLRRDGVRVRLRGKPFDLLILLLDAGGELVTRDELHKRLWPGAAVDFEGSLNAAMKRLRDTLRDSAETPTYIETLPTRGYRFLMKAEPLGVPAGATDATSRNEARMARERAERKKSRERFMLGFTLGLTLVAAAAGVSIALLQNSSKPVVHRLLVLPFENLSGNPEETYFSDGLTEEMITQLGRVNPQALRVIARTSAMQYRDVEGPIARARRDLDVDYVLEGAVRRDSGRVRISATLVETRDETQVWASTFDRDMSDMLSLQHDLAREIANALAVELRAAASPARAVNPEVFEATLRGRYHLAQQTGPGFRSAGDAFNAALALDPDYAPAWVGLADTWAMVGLYDFVPPKQAFTNAREAAEKALALDPDLAEAYATMGLIHCAYDWDCERAEADLRRAIDLNPGYAMAHQLYGNVLNIAGRNREARQQFEIARRIDPLSLILLSDIAWQDFLAGKYRRAERKLRAVLDLDPHFMVAHDNLAWVFFQRRKYDDWIQHAAKALELDGDHPDDIRRFREFYEREGWEALRRRSAMNMAHAAEREYVSPYDIALEYAAVGDLDEGIRWLHESVNQREVDAVVMTIDPRLESLHRDPRFDEVAARVVPQSPR